MDSDEDYDQFEGPQGKKRPKTGTDLIIDQALAEEQARKKAKLGGQEAVGPVKKRKDGKTLAEIEQEEGGPVKESLVGMAQVKRAQTRKKSDKAVDSTEVPADVEQFEEDAEVVEEEGVKFTGFNLTEERETGFFDDEGNYVERKVQDPTQKDAWMNSDEAKVVSDEVRKKIEARQKEEAAAEAAAQRQAPLTDRQIATLKTELAQHMQAGETLTRALKRHAGGTQGPRLTRKRDKKKSQQQQQEEQDMQVDTAQQQKQPDAAAAAGRADTVPATNEVFTRMTEIADQLLNEGETDIYTETKEDFEKSAAMWLPKQSAAGAQKPATNGAQAAAAATAASDEDDDMFAEDDEDSKPKKTVQQHAAVPNQPTTGAGDAADRYPQGTAGQAGVMGHTQAAQQPQPAAVQYDQVDYASWPVKELKRFLQERGLDGSSFVEKADMVAKVKELAAAGPVTSTTTATGAYPVPPGYVYDSTSGYYYSNEASMYYDATSGCYYNNGIWYTLDASGQFVQMAS